MTARRHILRLALASTLTAACAEKPSDKKADQPKSEDKGPETCLAIVSGKKTTDFPSVGLLAMVQDGKVKGVCTGTFVGRNTILTAAHCASEDPDVVVYVPGHDVDFGTTTEARAAALKKGKRPKKVLLLGKDIAFGHGDSMDPSKDSRRDLAILIFEDDVAPAVTPILERRAKEGETATIVGYGDTSIPEGGSPPSDASRVTKRRGTNKVRYWDEELFGPADDGVLLLTGAAETSGDKAVSMAGHGDSGGPLLVNDAIAGVASTGTHEGIYPEEIRKKIEGDALNSYADLSSDIAKEFLKKAEKAGAKIERGESGDAASGKDPSGGSSDASSGGVEEPCG